MIKLKDKKQICHGRALPKAAITKSPSRCSQTCQTCVCSAPPCSSTEHSAPMSPPCRARIALVAAASIHQTIQPRRDLLYVAQPDAASLPKSPSVLPSIQTAPISSAKTATQSVATPSAPHRHQLPQTLNAAAPVRRFPPPPPATSLLFTPALIKAQPDIFQIRTASISETSTCLPSFPRRVLLSPFQPSGGPSLLPLV
ncbi:hypothetical protein M0R45_019499 [Rubus argutus]|uniref:Uncharacterized protein n=1 Tax=Rubus argutus TaxID=59490 RepID=A0AAW1X7D7_RUBAR